MNNSTSNKSSTQPSEKRRKSETKQDTNRKLLMSWLHVGRTIRTPRIRAWPLSSGPSPLRGSGRDSAVLPSYSGSIVYMQRNRQSKRILHSKITSKNKEEEELCCLKVFQRSYQCKFWVWFQYFREGWPSRWAQSMSFEFVLRSGEEFEVCSPGCPVSCPEFPTLSAILAYNL